MNKMLRKIKKMSTVELKSLIDYTDDMIVYMFAVDELKTRYV